MHEFTAGGCVISTWFVFVKIQETTLKTTRQAFEKGIFNILFVKYFTADSSPDGIDHLRHDVSLFQAFMPRCGERIKSYAATAN